MSKRNKVSKEIFCEIVQNGDILLVSGNSFFSTFVRFFCSSQWSHVALVYFQNDEPYVLESILNTDSARSLQNSRGKKDRGGVRLVRLDEYLAHFEGYAIAVRPLERPSIVDEDQFNYFVAKKLEAFYAKYRDYPYQSSVWAFLTARTGMCVKRGDTMQTGVFCSELVTAFLTSAGLWKEEAFSRLPGDFAEGSKLTLELPRGLRRRAQIFERVEVTYGPEIYADVKPVSQFRCLWVWENYKTKVRVLLLVVLLWIVCVYLLFA